MISAEKYISFIEYLSSHLSKKRFYHSVSVEKECRLLAHRYGADDCACCIAGLLHDVTRGLSLDEQLTLVNRYDIITDDFQRSSANLLHAVTAPAAVQELFSINDADILDAIRYHTTGKPDMSLISKIIFIADFCEPTRQYSFSHEVRKLAHESIDKAVATALDLTITHLHEKNVPIHEDTLNAFAFYCKEKNLKI